MIILNRDTNIKIRSPEWLIIFSYLLVLFFRFDAFAGPITSEENKTKIYVTDLFKDYADSEYSWEGGKGKTVGYLNNLLFNNNWLIASDVEKLIQYPYFHLIDKNNKLYQTCNEIKNNNPDFPEEKTLEMVMLSYIHDRCDMYEYLINAAEPKVDYISPVFDGDLSFLPKLFNFENINKESYSLIWLNKGNQLTDQQLEKRTIKKENGIISIETCIKNGLCGDEKLSILPLAVADFNRDDFADFLLLTYENTGGTLVIFDLVVVTKIRESGDLEIINN